MSRLKLNLPKDPPGSPPERIRIRVGKDGPELWMTILSTSSTMARVQFDDEWNAYTIEKETSLLPQDSEGKK